MTTTLPNTHTLDLGPNHEIRNGQVFDTRDIRETTTGQSWEDAQHVHRTGDHWTLTFREGNKRFVNFGEGRLRSLDDFGTYKIEILDHWLPQHVSFDGYEIGEVTAEVRGDHTELGAAVAGYVSKVGVPTWFLAEHSNFTEEVWDAVLEGIIEPTLATTCEMLAGIHEVEALRDWEPRGSFPPDPFMEEEDGTPHATPSPLEQALTQRVNSLLGDAGMTVSDLADAAEIDYSDLCFLLTGHATWSFTEAFAVSEALGLSMSELFRQAQILADEETGK